MEKWQIEARCASGQERFGVQTVAAAIREYAGYEPAVREMVNEGNCIRLAIDKGLPKNGFRLCVQAVKDDVQQVFLQGEDENALMYACMDFVHVYLPRAAYSDSSSSPYYFFPVFGERPLPMAEQVHVPRIAHRGLWTWGHPIYDYRGYLESMAHLKLNEVIIWNDYLPVNARDVVEYAHSLGIKVIWGFAWGWDTSIGIDLSNEEELAKAADQVVAQYEREYADSNGDGIYFQSFTETVQEQVNGCLIAEVVVKWVNGIASRILARHPQLMIQFGLHALSVHGHLEYIAQTDPRVQIIWEDCGDFPYHYMPSRVNDQEKTRDFTERILSLRSNTVTGAVLKGMICLDWGIFEHQTGPYMMGCASQQTIANRQRQAARIWRMVQADWLKYGDFCRKTVGQLAQQDTIELYGLVEDGLMEKAIPLPVALFAGILWDCERDYAEILDEAARRPDVTFY